MNFTPELWAFQGAIISVDNVHDFSGITARGGNEEKILNVVATLFQFLAEKNYLTEAGITEEGQEQMKIYCFYLILNSDIPILNDLVQMPDIENIVWTVPTVNKCLLCEMVWGLGMEKYLSEILIFCNPMLSVEVLLQFAEYMKYSTPATCLKQMELLSLSCYRLICRLHFYDYENSVMSKIVSDIFEVFLRCTNYYVTPPNEDKLNHLSEDELYKYMGRNFHSLLKLNIDCLAYFLSHDKFESEGFDEMYLLTMKMEHIKTRSLSHKICESQNVLLGHYLHKCNIDLLDKCKILVMKTNVETFCAWSEFEENDKSMQQTIRETCYLLHSRVVKISSLLDHPLINMLPELSCKPTDIHDIIKTSDNDTLIQNANQISNDQLLWLQAIIEKNYLQENRDLLVCLLSNIGLIEDNYCANLFRRLTKFLNDNESQHEGVLKLLAIKSFSKLSPNLKAEYVGHHFSDEIFHNGLQSDDFHNMNTELFNKLLAAPNTNLSDIYDVFIQNPIEVYKKILQSAIFNSTHSDLMVNVMTMLKPYINHYYTSDTEPAFVKAIKFISQNPFENDMRLNNFITFISKLKNGNIFCGTKLLLLIIMPGLHKALLNKDVLLINMSVMLLKKSFEVNELIQYRAPLLAMIAQILETVRWSLATFVSDAPSTLEESLKLQIDIFGTYQSSIPDKEANWLKSKLKHLQPFNMYYYKDLWNPPGNNFLEIITGGVNLNVEKLPAFLAKILCSSTPQEWIDVWKCIEANGDVMSLQIMYDALKLMTTAVESKRNEKTWACLLYCFRNFMFIIKNEFFKEPLSDSYVENVAEILIELINKQREEDVDDVSTITLTLFSYIAERKADYKFSVAGLGNKVKHAKVAGLINQLFCI